VVAIINMVTKSKFKTYTVGFKEKHFDETIYAKKVAQTLNVQYKILKTNIFPDMTLKNVIKFLDEPFADSSALPTFCLCKEVSRHSKVAISGDGGDEIFAGYTFRYRIYGMQEFFKNYRLNKFVPYFQKICNFFKTNSSFSSLLSYTLMPFDEIYSRTRSLVSSDLIKVLSPEITKDFSGEVSFPFDMKSAKKIYDGINLALYYDIFTSLSDDMLFKVDRMSMANSLEVRVPLLDHKFLEFVMKIPGELKLKIFRLQEEGKYILRKTMESYLPKKVLLRKKKGFSVPLKKWMKDYFLEDFDELYSVSSNNITDYLNYKEIKNLRKNSEDNFKDLYALLIFGLCKKKFW
jgi:asparagine synthase (glutamine-hydrolysing)